MATTVWKSMRPDIVAYINRCPTFEIDRYAQEAARVFMRDSHCWRERGLTLLTTVADQSDYTYTPPTDGELLQVHAAWDDDDEVNVSLPGENDDRDPAYNDTTWTVAVAGVNTIRVSPLPETAGVVIKGSASFIPSVTGLGLPTPIFDEWRKQIASGAIAMLAAMPDKPWTNPSLVVRHQDIFDAAIREASNEAGPVRRKPLRVTPW